MARWRQSAACFTLVVGLAAFTPIVGLALQHDEHKPATPTKQGAKPTPKPTSPHEAGMHTHSEAAKLTNPVKSDTASIAAGQKLYTTHCAMCHGPSGAGDGVQAAKYNPKPSNLADATWKHGPTDGEIFTVIRNGIPKTAMSSAFSKKISERQTWDVVNFVRSIGPKTDPTHAH